MSPVPSDPATTPAPGLAGDGSSVNGLTPTDKSLVVMVRDGDQEAASVLYERYARRVFGLVRSKLGPRLSAATEPDDIVQSVFKSVFRGMQSGSYEAPPGSTLWNLLAVISVRKLSSRATHLAAKCRDTSRNVPLDHGGEESSGMTDAFVDPVAVEFLELCIRESLDLLRPTHRKVLALRIEGHTVDEIAAATGRARRTVERILQDSRRVLADALMET